MRAAALLLAALAAACAGARPRPARPSGGLAERCGPGLAVRLVDAGASLPRGAVEGAARALRLRARVKAEAARAEAPAEAWRAAAEAARAPGAAAAVLFADRPSAPLVVASPDGRWAVVNALALPGSGARLEAVAWRAAALALGAGWGGGAPGPEEHNALVDAARARGVGRVEVASYRDACRAGWAPAPADAAQRAIWEEARAERERGPARGLLIVPPRASPAGSSPRPAAR